MIAVFDCETSGLISNSAANIDIQPHVIEFAGVIINREGAIVEELDFLIKPPMKLDPVITKITGLTDEKLANEQLLNHGMVERIQKFFDKSQIAVAHNFSFDRGMMEFTFARVGRQLRWPSRLVCTVEATEHIKGRRMKLAQLYQHFFNEDFTGAHRAMNDVKALARITAKMVEEGLI